MGNKKRTYVPPTASTPADTENTSKPEEVNAKEADTSSEETVDVKQTLEEVVARTEQLEKDPLTDPDVPKLFDVLSTEEIKEVVDAVAPEGAGEEEAREDAEGPAQEDPQEGGEEEGGTDDSEGAVDSEAAEEQSAPAAPETPVVQAPVEQPPVVEDEKVQKAADAAVQFANKVAEVKNQMHPEERKNIDRLKEQALPKGYSQAMEVKPATTEELRAELEGVVPTDHLLAMDRAALLLYKEKKVLPAKTLRGNHQVDVRRQRNLREWTLAQMLDWMDGHIKAPVDVTDEDLWDELYRRHKIPGNWTHEDAKAYIESGAKPEYTKDGVLINDRMREGKRLSQWTFIEIRSALIGQIKSPYSQDELVTAYRNRLNLKDTFSTQRIMDNIENSPTEVSVDNAMLKSTLEEYQEYMTKSGTNLSPETAGDYQVILAKAIRKVMQRDTRSFIEGWNILLDWINENYSKLFTDDLARRGWSHMGLSKTQLATFEDLLTLMIHTRKPSGRAREAKLYNIPNILRYVHNEQERANVLQFYSDEFQNK